MSALRVSLYEHIAAARWRLLDQGFVAVSDGSNGARSVFVDGSSQFPAIFSFSPGHRITRVGSWFQWTQDVEGSAATFALRFGCSPDSEAFASLLPLVSIQSQSTPQQPSSGSQPHSLKDSPDAPLPAHIHHISVLSDDLHRIRSDCVSMSRTQDNVLAATISVIRAMSDCVNRAPVAASGNASNTAHRAAHGVAAASVHAV